MHWVFWQFVLCCEMAGRLWRMSGRMRLWCCYRNVNINFTVRVSGRRWLLGGLRDSGSIPRNLAIFTVYAPTVEYRVYPGDSG